MTLDDMVNAMRKKNNEYIFTDEKNDKIRDFIKYAIREVAIRLRDRSIRKSTSKAYHRYTSSKSRVIEKYDNKINEKKRDENIEENVEYNQKIEEKYEAKRKQEYARANEKYQKAQWDLGEEVEKPEGTMKKFGKFMKTLPGKAWEQTKRAGNAIKEGTSHALGASANMIKKAGKRVVITGYKGVIHATRGLKQKMEPLREQAEKEILEKQEYKKVETYTAPDTSLSHKVKQARQENKPEPTPQEQFASRMEVSGEVKKKIEQVTLKQVAKQVNGNKTKVINVRVKPKQDDLTK